MFYEASQIETILKCPHCKNTFDEPRNLPCGKVVCSRCIQIIVQGMNKTDVTFTCLICDKIHSKSEFPVNEVVIELLQKQPSEVYRGKKVDELKLNLKEISSNKIKLENVLRNSKDHLKVHCLKIRGDIDLATEKAIHGIQQQRDELLKKIDEYYKNTIMTMQNDKDANEEFENTINELDQFSERWSSYLNKPIIDDTEVNKSNDIAIELKKRAQLKMKQLDSLIFNDNKIFYENNSEKFVIGDIQFEKMTLMPRKIDSLILSGDLEKSLLSLIGFESKKFDLLWRGSRDGFSAKTFHSLCDNKGETLTVVKSTSGYTFGGYTSLSWASSGGNKPDNKAFLFTLTNPSNLPLKLMNKGGQVYLDSRNGPTFGHSGYDDLGVSSDSNLNTSSCCYSGWSYEAPNGHNGENGGKFIHGGGMGSNIHKFKTTEVEIFLIS